MKFKENLHAIYLFSSRIVCHLHHTIHLIMKNTKITILYSSMDTVLRICREKKRFKVIDLYRVVLLLFVVFEGAFLKNNKISISERIKSRIRKILG